jgi:hypothetical protein
LYTAPANVTTVVRCIIASNGDGTAKQLWVQRNVSGFLASYLYRNLALASATAEQIDLRAVLNPGDTLEVGTTGTDATFNVMGYSLF